MDYRYSIRKTIYKKWNHRHVLQRIWFWKQFCRGKFSKNLFSKEPKDLTISESAILVGMFKNSGLYNQYEEKVWQTAEMWCFHKWQKEKSSPKRKRKTKFTD
jgi:hypothetical protein